MKIYFAGSIRGGRDDAKLYKDIVTHLQTYGKVLTEHVASPHLTEMGEDGPNDKYIYDRDMKWIKQADILIAEVTLTSLGVGFEISQMVSRGKKILCLYRPTKGKRLSAMIAGCPEIVVKEYLSFEEAKEIIDEFINEINN